MEHVDFVNENIGREASIEQLQSFCRGEMSAVETYRQAIAAAWEEWVILQLQRNLASHESRVELLARRIEEIGGDIPESSGPWGLFAKTLEGAAAALGEKSALSVLEEGEDHGLKDYRSDLRKLDFDSRRMIRDEILPQQVETHRTLSEIKRAMG